MAGRGKASKSARGEQKDEEKGNGRRGKGRGKKGKGKEQKLFGASVAFNDGTSFTVRDVVDVEDDENYIRLNLLGEQKHIFPLANTKQVSIVPQESDTPAEPEEPEQP
jgi:hypothetical protein